MAKEEAADPGLVDVEPQLEFIELVEKPGVRKLTGHIS